MYDRGYRGNDGFHGYDLSLIAISMILKYPRSVVERLHLLTSICMFDLFRSWMKLMTGVLSGGYFFDTVSNDRLLSEAWADSAHRDSVNLSARAKFALNMRKSTI